MNKYDIAKQALQLNKKTEFKVFGNSMLPILKSGAILTFEQATDYEIGDIVFCRVKGRYIDAHKVVAKDAKRGWLIANNHGHDNGWTHTIYGKVVSVRYD